MASVETRVDDLDAAVEETPQRMPNGIPTLFAAVFLIWLVGIYFSMVGRESYPQVAMPPFVGAGVSGSVVELREVRLTVVDRDGDKLDVDAVDLMPHNPVAPAYAAKTVFKDPDVARDPETVEWLRQQLQRVEPDLDAVRIEVTWLTVHYDRSNGDRVDGKTLDQYVIDMGGGRG